MTENFVLLRLQTLWMILLLVNRKNALDAPSFREQYRLQYHFSPPKNFMNDPNGLVYVDGTYHLFYQHNPFGNVWGHMSWGHATSEDLVHWTHLPVAIPEDGDLMAFSGSAVWDGENTSGLGNETHPPMVAIYTGHNSVTKRQDQRIAYSTDEGNTWTIYADNPVIDINSTAFRDPKVFRYKNSWIMVLALSDERKVRFYKSSDLIDWTHLSDFGPQGHPTGIWECPELFELPVKGGKGRMKKWVLQVDLGSPGALYGGSGGEYFIGEFNGSHFLNDNPSDAAAKWVDYGADFYAAQSWNNVPDNRRVWIGWFNNWKYANDIPTSPWRGSMSVPRDVSLRLIRGEVKLIQTPIPELKTLRVALDSDQITPADQQQEFICEVEHRGANVTFKLLAKQPETETILQVNPNANITTIDRTKSGDTSFNPGFPEVHEAPTYIDGPKLNVHIFTDASSIEVFINDGEVVLSDRIFPDNDAVEMSITGIPEEDYNCTRYRLTSIWQDESASTVQTSKQTEGTTSKTNDAIAIALGSYPVWVAILVILASIISLRIFR